MTMVRFNLRSVFALTFLLSLALAWFVWQRQDVVAQRALVRDINARGGTVGGDLVRGWQGRWRRFLLLGDAPFNLTSVRLDGTTGADAILLRLETFPNLESLSLSRSDVTDAGLAKIRGYRKLDQLALQETRITGAGLTCLARMPELKCLFPCDSELTPEGLRHLNSTDLELLSLNGTNCNDDWLRELKGLKSLRGLTFHRTAVTEEGVRELTSSLAINY